MTRDIVLGPAEVVALGERTNQARLNNGCVCPDGCDSCDRLAEAFEAMREALQHVTTLAAEAAMGTYRTSVQVKEARAALRLADRVKGVKP